MARHRLSITSACTRPAGQRTFDQPPNPLIGSSAIRIPRNSRRINDLSFSNRHKTRPFCGAGFQPAQLRTAEKPPVAARESRITSLVALLLPGHKPQILIGPPVIRISAKSFAISLVSDSNRHKRSRSPGAFPSRSALATSHCPRPFWWLTQPAPFRDTIPLGWASFVPDCSPSGFRLPQLTSGQTDGPRKTA